MKKNPIIFIAMLIALAFTSCQMNTDDSVVTPPAPTYTITVTGDQTNGSAKVTNASDEVITSAKAGENVTLTVTPNSGYKFDATITINGQSETQTDSAERSYTMAMPSSNITVNVSFTQISNNNGGNGTGEAEETSVTIPNVNVYIETHENGLGLNDGKKHGSFKLSKEGNTVTITVLPETGYELGYVLTKDTYGNVKLMNKNGEPITTEAESPIRIRATYNNNGSTEAHNLSITEASNGVYTFEMLDNVIVNLKARFDPIAGYTVKSNNLPIAKEKTASATSTENISVKPGNYFTVDWKSKSDVASLTIGGKDYSDFLKTSLTNISLLMPAHDVAVTTTLKKQQ